MRAGKGYGPNRIRAELAERGVEESLQEQALSCWDGDWEQLAGEVREKKYGRQLPTDWDNKVKQSRFLQYRGFGGEQISKVMRD
jgi:regulatory protein